MAVGVASSTHALWSADPAWQEELEAAGARFESAMVGSIVNDGIKLRSWRAKLEVLRARWPESYAAYTRLDVRVAQREPEVEVVEMLSPEARADRLRALIAEAERRLQVGAVPEPSS